MMERKRIMTLTARVDEDVEAAIRELARLEDRTVSKYIERILRQHVADRQADLPTKPKRSGK
jgi:predicted transcriptional regulator